VRTPEGWEKAEIDKYLESIGAYVVKPATFGYGGSGHADRIFCYRGRFGAIEVKREGKEPTKLQELRMEEVRKAGGVAFWGTAQKVCTEIEEWRR
jgi:hypothetical protein